jgi:hypothetical protein
MSVYLGAIHTEKEFDSLPPGHSGEYYLDYTGSDRTKVIIRVYDGENWTPVVAGLRQE